MAAKLTRLTHRIATQLHLVTAIPFAVLAQAASQETFGYTLVHFLFVSFKMCGGREQVVTVLCPLNTEIAGSNPACGTLRILDVLHEVHEISVKWGGSGCPSYGMFNFRNY